LVTREHVAAGPLRAVVCNSGNANACNGPQGLSDARAMAQLTAEALGCAEHEVAVASTGVIGQPLDMEKVSAGIREAAGQHTADGGEAAAQAIMTTDTRAKALAVAFECDGRLVRLGGMAKGSGMIHPNMATMLAFLTTDAAFDPATLEGALKYAVDRSFNAITVDGDTSTNDMALLLANGAAGVACPPGSAAFDRFQEALVYLCRQLARWIVADGEGATKLVAIQVSGAPDFAAARQIGKSVATSALVKTALYGEDANWGRIICAAGYSGVTFDPDRVDISIGPLAVARGGMGLPFDEARAKEILGSSELTIAIDLHQGEAEATVWTCDFSYEYVKINASYRS
ncbi:MAG TPA: bifunctional glutamate N-acetyltransferase/amino-acid acetyltransferase ArgJ, partial [Limnochordia bacterium]|nr:bifunctional glutamate N-acetyltransferase/amino-acid acetyltransferase ArgJ [Limnochordia bacterium]